MLDNNKCIIVLGLDEEEMNQLKMADLRIVEVTDKMASMRVGDIIDGFDMVRYDVRLPKEKIILFNNFDNVELKATIEKVRQITKEGILAAVTPTSINWSFEYLVSHLLEERDWMKRR